MARRIEWPYEDIVMEVCWNGDPDRCEEIPREFLPEPRCANCAKRSECDLDAEDMDNVCERYEWNEDIDSLREEPREPRREEYRTEKAFRRAKQCVREWYMQNTDRYRE